MYPEAPLDLPGIHYSGSAGNRMHFFFFLLLGYGKNPISIQESLRILFLFVCLFPVGSCFKSSNTRKGELKQRTGWWLKNQEVLYFTPVIWMGFFSPLLLLVLF